MIDRRWRRLLSALCLSGALLLDGCAGQKSIVVLLPEDGRPSGEVTVTNRHGSQLLNQSRQASEIGGAGAGPATPVILDEESVRRLLAPLVAARPLPAVHFRIFFKLDSAEFVPDSEPLLAEILRAIHERQPAELSVVGHTDTVESDPYNYRLGLMRAQAVEARLKAMGAVPAFVEISSRGKSELLVPTADQALEPRNRRAEVTIR
jgi:outer membrane protein OmpA-like peptidoglycan-associated protein